MPANPIHTLFKKLDVVHWLIVLSFAVWMIGVRDFLSLKLPLSDDAHPYYEHIRFYIENLMRGTLPLWDPVNMYCNGVPNDFFLRRIGPYNPFLILPALVNAVGVPFKYAYTFYLAMYYWVGTIGFYLVARLVVKDRVASFAAYALLLFSSLGLRLFDSYIVFLFVPIIWFFYFLLKFQTGRVNERFAFLGIVVTLMIIVTTYLPFYFLTIFLTFVMCYAAVYWDNVFNVFRRFIGFFSRNKFLSVSGIAAVLLALLPGALFYVFSKRGNIVMPHRSAESAADQVIEVKQHWIIWWGIIEEMIYSGYFLRDLREMQHAVIFVSFFAAAVLILGLFRKTNRFMFFLGIWTLLLFLIGIPRGNVYQFVSEHIFYFKYFRNLHFILWLGILPLVILFIAEQIRLLRGWTPKTGWQKVAAAVAVVAVHAALIVFFEWWGKPLGTFYVMMVLSAAFWISLWAGAPVRTNNRLLCVFLLAIIAVQPLEVFYALSLRKPITPPGITDYERPYYKFSYTKKKNWDKDIFGNSYDSPPVLFYATKWLNTLVRHIRFDVYDNYAHYRFLLYDNVEAMHDDHIDFGRVEDSLGRLDNAAFVPTADYPGRRGRTGPSTATPVLEDSDEFRVLAYSMNSIKIRTNFSKPRFLVFNDSFHPGWKATVNGEAAEIIRANIAFKGLWLPGGENIVSFRYGTARQYFVELGLLILTYALFVWLICTAWNRREAE